MKNNIFLALICAFVCSLGCSNEPTSNSPITTNQTDRLLNGIGNVIDRVEATEKSHFELKSKVDDIDVRLAEIESRAQPVSINSNTTANVRQPANLPNTVTHGLHGLMVPQIIVNPCDSVNQPNLTPIPEPELVQLFKEKPEIWGKIPERVTALEEKVSAKVKEYDSRLNGHDQEIKTIQEQIKVINNQ